MRKPKLAYQMVLLFADGDRVPWKLFQTEAGYCSYINEHGEALGRLGVKKIVRNAVTLYP